MLLSTVRWIHQRDDVLHTMFLLIRRCMGVDACLVAVLQMLGVGSFVTEWPLSLKSSRVTGIDLQPFGKATFSDMERLLLTLPPDQYDYRLQCNHGKAAIHEVIITG